MLKHIVNQTARLPVNMAICQQISVPAAQLLGLRGREQYLDRQVSDAYEELRGLELESGYTPRVAAGRTACLEEARRALQASRGRVTRDAAGVQVAHDALPGALALLQEVRAGSRVKCSTGTRSAAGALCADQGHAIATALDALRDMCRSGAAFAHVQLCLLVLPASRATEHHSLDVRSPTQPHCGLQAVLDLRWTLSNGLHGGRLHRG